MKVGGKFGDDGYGRLRASLCNARTSAGEGVRRGRTDTPLTKRRPCSGMPVKFSTSGCLVSIVASIVLTVALNLLLRACTA